MILNNKDSSSSGSFVIVNNKDFSSSGSFFMIRLFDYISRIGKSRGFGIQSPWAYSFVRDVINEKYSYYVYENIDNQFSRKERKWAKLRFRLRNYNKGKEYGQYSLNGRDFSQVEFFLKQNVSQSFVVIEDIYKNKACEELWRKVKKMECVGCTFDLYKCAVCFYFDGKIKQHYKLNL